MKKILAALSLYIFPVLAFAQEGEGIRSLEDILNFIVKLINVVIPIIIALAVLVFIWGVFKYVVSDSEEAKKKGKDIIIYGIVGIFIMVSVWGLVNILDNTFNLDNETVPDLPELPSVNDANETPDIEL